MTYQKNQPKLVSRSQLGGGMIEPRTGSVALSSKSDAHKTQVETI